MKKKLKIPKEFRQPREEPSKLVADTNDPRTVTVEQSLALYSCPLIKKQPT